MNRIHRIVWNQALQVWQAVAECSRSRGKRAGGGRSRRRLALTATAGLFGVAAAGSLWAQGATAATLPSGAQVAAGQAQISQQGPVLTVMQGSARLVTDWQSFNIGAGNTVNFVQPSASAVALNRVLGNDVSLIQGALKANGQVFLLNPNGVLFTPSAQVDVGGLLASTLNMSNEDFLAGRYRLAGDSGAAVINQGRLRAADGGSVALVAARVVNTGAITANAGQVLLGAGSQVTLDLGGPVALRIEQAALDALIEQGGAIRADGGRILLSVKAAADLHSTVISHTGISEARALASGPGGEIRLLGEGGIVAAGGALDVSAAAAGGGRIVATGGRVLVDGTARLDARGDSGGGLIQVGGGWQGQDAGVANAQDVIVREGARLLADAQRQGDGGTVVVWADGSTQFAGAISARGGATGGDGGAVEVSGKAALGFSGAVDTSAAHGRAGRLLLDPSTLTITDGSAGQTGSYANWSNQADFSGYSIPETVLEGLTGNVELTAVTDIIINNLADNELTLSATNISFFANDESGPSGSGGFTMRDINDTIRLNQGAGSAIVFQGGSVSSRNTALNSNAPFSSASIFVGNVVTNGADVVFNTKRSTAALPMIVNGSITTNGGSIAVTPGTRFGLANSNAVNVQLLGAVDTGGGSFSSNMTGTVAINGGLSLGSGSASFGGTGTQINSLVQSTSNITISAPLSFGAGAGITTTGAVTFNSTASMLAGGDLTLTASNFVFNNTFSGNAAAITLRPYSAATNVDIGSAGSGGMLISSAMLGQLNNFGNITIGRSDATGITTVVSDTSVATSGRLEIINRQIDVTGGTLANTSGDVVLTGNTINIGKSVSSGAVGGVIGLQHLDPASPLQLSVTGAASLGGSVLDIGSAGGSDVVLNSDVATTAGTVHIRSGGNVDGSAGGISVAELAVSAGGAVILTDSSFDFTTLALSAGGDSHAKSSQAFTVDTVDGVVGANAAGFGLTLQTTGSGTVTAVQPITAQSLLLLGHQAGFDLSGANHTVGRLAANVSGGLVFGNSAALEVGSVAAVSGVTAGAVIDIHTLGGNLLVSQPVVTASTAATAITLNAGKAAAAGNSSGGDIVVSGSAALQTGSNGRSTLYSGSVVGSTGLAALVGNGSGRFRYHSDEASTGYDSSAAALGSGAFAVYRERPMLSVAAAAASMTYGDALPAMTASTSGLVNGDTLAGNVSGTAVFSVGGAVSTAGHAVAGSHDLVYSGGLSSVLGYGLQDDSGSSGELQVGTRNLALGGLTAAHRAYDGTRVAALSGSAAVAALGSDAVSVAGSAVGEFASKTVGSGKAVLISGLVLAGADAANYTLTGLTTTADITPATLTLVGLAAQNKVYDGSTAATLTGGTLSGLFGGDQVSASLSGASFVSAAAGQGKTVSAGATLAGADAGNYVLSPPSGLSADITPRPITVTADGKTKVYGNGDPGLSYQVSSGSLVVGDTLTGALTRSAGENVGSYTIDASVLANTNYTVTAINGALSITPRPITVTADGKTKVYGNGDPALSYQISSGNLIGTDVLTGSLSRSTGENVGSYAIDASALANANYSVTAVNGALSITPRPITVTADGKTKVYGNSDPALSYQVSSGNLIGSDVLTGTLVRGAGENVGSYAIDASVLANTNYTVTAVNGTLSITPRPITVAADGKAKVYGNADPALSYQISSGNLVGNDSLSGALARSTGENVGSYTIDASALANTNYTVTAVSGTLSITPRPITVTADGKTKVYGNGDPALSYQVSSGNVIGSDVLTGSLSRSAGENVGSYAIDASALANTNYTVTAMNGTLSITPRPITVTADGKSKVYGNNDPALSYQVSTGNLVGSDTLTGALTRGAGENVGSYTIDASALANTNYTVTAVNGALSITPRPITVTADGKTKVYGNGDPALSYQVSSGNLIGTDVLTGSLSRSTGENVGSYAIDASALANANYSVTAVNGALSITPRPITVTADGKSKVYGNGDPALSYQVSSGNLIGSDVLTGTLVRGAGENVGSYAIDASALVNANYTVTAVNGALSITPRPITVTADGKTKVYGNNDPGFSYQVSTGNLVGSDTLTGALVRGTGENVGSYAIDASALANTNYTVTAVNGTLRITPRPVTVTADGKTKVYGNGDPALSYQVSSGNLVGSDTLTGALTRSPGENVGGYAIDASSLANANYSVTAINGVLSITPRAITVTAEGKTKVYGNNDPALSYQVSTGNLVGSDTLAGALTRNTGENVGSYAIDASALANTNYTVTAVNGTLSITPRPITVTADGKTKVYGNNDPGFSYQVSSGNLIGNDSLSGALARSTGENVGSYTIDASALANTNYTVTAVNSTLSITPRPLTVAADGKTKVYGNADPALSYQITSGTLVGNDSLSGALVRSPGEGVGGYAIDASALANGNYALTSVNGVLTITPALHSNVVAGNEPVATAVQVQAAALPAHPPSGPGAASGGLVLTEVSEVPVRNGLPGSTVAAAASAPGAARLFVLNGGIRLAGPPDTARANPDNTSPP